VLAEWLGVVQEALLVAAPYKGKVQCGDRSGSISHYTPQNSFWCRFISFSLNQSHKMLERSLCRFAAHLGLPRENTQPLYSFLSQRVLAQASSTAAVNLLEGGPMGMQLR